MFRLERFINQYVTKREKSMFASDIEANMTELKEKLTNKSVLVIGGAVGEAVTVVITLN